MKNLYDITKWQFITLWIFSVVAWILIVQESCNWYKDCNIFSIGATINTPVYDWLAILIPFVVLFYTIGWRNNKKS